MFIKDRLDILKAIELLQRKQCCYDSFGVVKEPSEPPPMCDCKYGYSGEENYGEDTGCPELRCAAEILKLMSDIEYREIMKRGRHIGG